MKRGLADKHNLFFIFLILILFFSLPSVNAEWNWFCAGGGTLYPSCQSVAISGINETHTLTEYARTLTATEYTAWQPLISDLDDDNDNEIIIWKPDSEINIYNYSFPLEYNHVYGELNESTISDSFLIKSTGVKYYKIEGGGVETSLTIDLPERIGVVIYKPSN